MTYPFPDHRIRELVNAPKCVSEGHEVLPEAKGSHGAQFAAPLDLVDGPFCDLNYRGKAGILTDPTTYDASLLLAARRVRGVGHCAVARNNFRRKERVPAGWHQNVCNPNAPTDSPEWNLHEPLPDFAPTDFSDFIRKTSGLWAIDLGWQEELL